MGTKGSCEMSNTDASRVLESYRGHSHAPPTKPAPLLRNMPKFTPKSPSTAQYLRASNAKLFEMQTVLLTKPRSERAELKKEIEALDSEIRNKERESLSKHIDGSQLGSSSELWNRAKAPLD